MHGKNHMCFDATETIYGEEVYIPPRTLHDELDHYDIPYIPNLWEGLGYELNADKIKELVNSNMFLIDPKKGDYGEGIVIKNYDYINKYGRITWAKVLHDEYSNGSSSKKAKLKTLEEFDIEHQIIDKYVTSDFVEKEYAKIISDNPSMERKLIIPRLLSISWKVFIEEESYNFIKEFKKPTINFRALNKMFNDKIKKTKKDLF